MKSITGLREALIESAVRIVAQHGFEKTMTKPIASDAHVNEVYIYRCYENKDALLNAAFHAEDIRLAELVHKTMPVMRTVGLSRKERCFLLWKPCWDFMVHRPDGCRFYLQYCCSAGCRQYHMKSILRFADLWLRRYVPYSVRKPTRTCSCIGFSIQCSPLRRECCPARSRTARKTAKRTFEQVYNFVRPNAREDIDNI